MWSNQRVQIEGVADDEYERGQRAFSLLERSRQFGFLGPGPIEPHIVHAFGFLQALRRKAGERTFETAKFVDLGGGGGLPGLVLALALPRSSWLFLDTNRRRMDAMEIAIGELGISDRVQIHCERAELAARLPGFRHEFDVVMARGLKVSSS
jgi:16S rRNA (guanine527-N7)-methyltransferase